jgi:DNA-binding NtrC family response regulator
VKKETPPGTRVITDPNGRSRRQVREYRLVGAGVAQSLTASLLRLGSHQQNDVTLDHDTVSRFHAEIEAGPDGFLVRDLDSTNGTTVNGLRIREAFLPGRATLKLGDVSLEFAVTQATADLPLTERDEFHGVLGRSPAMRELFHALERAAPTGATVLLEGESGTGKELVAQAVHRAGGRQGPFVVLDCAAVPANLMESELLGHERGAFTGAVSRYEGRFREADTGTLFLDEIGELPLEMQPKLLRVLESRQVRPLGGTASHAVDVRLVAATNRNLAREVNRGTFREDLYYRLAVVQVKVPPLRERPEDVRLLVEHFVRASLPDEPERAMDIIRGISAQNWRRLEGLPWPGNVRELRNFIERTLILSGGPIQSAHIPLGQAEGDGSPLPDGVEVDLEQPFSQLKAETISRFERAYLFGQLKQHGGNVSAAARASGLDRMNFKRLLKKYH